MKQHSILSFSMASIASILSISLLAVSCQKEEAATVTLGARIEESVNGDAKAYIDGYTPCWHNGDKVYINNAAYPVVAASGSSAQIENVTASASYRALFPASLVTPGVDISENSTFPITLPSVQRYELVGDHQRVDVPMGAYLTNGSTLQFYNLCSIVRVTVSNSLNRALPLRHIAVRTDNAMLSGAGTAAVSGQSVNRIVLSNTASHSVCLGFNEECPVTVAARGSKTFDIVVPAFTTRDHVTFTLYTTDGYYFEMDRNNVALGHNSITTATMNVTGLTEIVAAELVNGAAFNGAIPDNATAVVFEYNNPAVTSGTLLSTTDSPVPIYGNLDGTTWHVSTAAHMMNANPNCNRMFNHKGSLTSINFGEGFNTSNVIDMSEIFSFCSSLESLDVSHFNTSNVTNMGYMFYYCSGLTSLDVSHFNTSNVSDMGCMFLNCSSLVTIDVSQFNTSNVIDMGGLFALCRNLTSLDVSHFNTGNVTNMNWMFIGCIGLTSIDVSNFITSNVISMGSMFCDCISLTNLDVSNFNTSNVTDMGYMFSGCRNLTSLDVSHFNTSNVTNMYRMFYECRGLSSLGVSQFNTSNVTDMHGMFESCSRLTSLDVSNFNTANVTDMSRMFLDCQGLTSLDVSHFNTGNVTDMARMFSLCTHLNSLDVSGFNTENVTDMTGMFSSCNRITSLDVSDFNTLIVTNMRDMFYGCSSLTSLDLSSFITSSVTNTSYMFGLCNSLVSLDLSNFNTSLVTDMSRMFYACSNLTSLNLDNFDMSGLGYTEEGITYSGKENMCKNLSSISEHCTITCPLAVETAMQTGTNLPSGVTFTWQRPASSK